MADRTVSVKLKAAVAEYMASMRAAGGATKDLEKAARDVRKAHDEEADAAGRVRTAEAKLNELRADSKTKASQLAGAEEQLARAHRTLEVAQDNTAASTARFTKAQEAAGESAGKGMADGVADGMDKNGGKVDKAAERMAKRTNAQFDALKFTGLSVGLPAAAAVGVAGAGLLLAAIPLLFAGIGASAVMSNDRVQASLGALTATVESDTERMAAGLAGPVAGAGDELRNTFVALEPQIQAAFTGSAPAVSILAGTVSDFATGAMPGFVTAIKSSKAPLEGLQSLAGQAGDGFTDLFTNMSAGSANAGHGLSTLGGIAQDAEGFLGSLLANLANGSAGPLSAFQSLLRQGESALLALTATGSGALGFLTGFTNGASGMVTILRLVVGLMSALPPQVTQFAGSFAASSMLLSKFGVDAGAGFEGLGAKVRGAGNDLDGAAKAGAKTGTALRGLVDGAMSPAFLATAALSIGLGLLGQAQADAAAQAQAHRERVNDLASALRQSNGAIDENVRKTAAMALQDFDAGDGKRNLLKDVSDLLGDKGITMLTDAYLGNKDAGDELAKSVHGLAVTHTDAAGEMDGVATKALDLGGILGDTNGIFGQAAEKNKQLGVAASGTSHSMTELDAAMSTLRGTAVATADRINAVKTALDILSGRTPTFEEGIQAGNDSLRSFAEQFKDGVKHIDGYGKALLNADGSVNTFTANGSSLQNLAQGLQGSFVDTASAIDEMVRRGVPFDQATKRVNDGLAEQRNRFITVAEKMLGSASAAKALADKYGLIPTEIGTLVTANTKQAEAAIKFLPNIADNTAGAVIISADVDKATGKITSVVQYADKSMGVITVDGDKDPATGKIDVAVQYANGQKSHMSIDAFNQAAKDRTIEAKRFADGTVAWVLVNANTAGAEAQINQVARNRVGQITMIVRTDGSVRLPNGNIMNARGGMYSPAGVGFAGGGFPTPTASNRIGSQAVMVPPGTLKWAGDANVDELFAPLDGSARTAGLLVSAMEHENLFGNSVWQSIQSGNAVVQSPVMTSSASAGGYGAGSFDVRVFVGNEEITSIVRTEVRQSNRATKRAVTAGAGRAR